jgi:hypothetical protein
MSTSLCVVLMERHMPAVVMQSMPRSTSSILANVVFVLKSMILFVQHIPMDRKRHSEIAAKLWRPVVHHQ